MRQTLLQTIVILLAICSPAIAEYSDELEKALAFLNENNPKQALGVLETIPNTADAGINVTVGMLKGRAYLTVKDFENAESTLRDVIAKEPSAWSLRHPLAEVLAAKKEYSEAYEMLDRFVRDFHLKYSKCEMKKALCLLENDPSFSKEKEELLEKSISELEKKIPET